MELSAGDSSHGTVSKGTYLVIDSTNAGETRKSTLTIAILSPKNMTGK